MKLNINLKPVFLEFPQTFQLKDWQNFLEEVKDLQTLNYYDVSSYIEIAQKNVELLKSKAHSCAVPKH